MSAEIAETLVGLISIAVPMLLMGWLAFGRRPPVFRLYAVLSVLVLVYLGATHVMTDVGGAVMQGMGYQPEKPKLPTEI